MRRAIDKAQAALSTYHFAKGMGLTEPLCLQRRQSSVNRGNFSPGKVIKATVAPELAEIVKEKLTSMGAFDYKALDDGIAVDEYGPVLIEKDAVYVGEWSRNKIEKHGSGKIIFADGGIFEGHWV